MMTAIQNRVVGKVSGLNSFWKRRLNMIKYKRNNMFQIAFYSLKITIHKVMKMKNGVT